MNDRLRERFAESSERLRDRIDGPLGHAEKLARGAAGWFPVRVWRRFLRHDGFLLAAGLSYQSLFALFAVVYIVFSGVGVWLGASATAITAAIELIDRYVPGIIRDEGGVFTPDQVTAVASQSAGVLTITGIVAVGVLIWTAIGFVTFTRRAVRNIFALPFDQTGYFRLKGRDFIAAIGFGGTLLVGALIGGIGTWALRLIFDLLSWSTASIFFRLGAGTVSLLISFAINTAALAALYRFLAGTTLPLRTTVPGAAIAGAGVTVLQFGAGLLVLYSPTNPLLATFAVFIFLLLWFRVVGVVILVGASWTAEAADDAGLGDRLLSEEERADAERAALLVSAHVRLRDARAVLAGAGWWRRPSARRGLARAERDLERLEIEDARARAAR